MQKKKLLIIITNHFDLAWRRCFERRIEFDGKYLVSYAELQEYFITENIKLADKRKDYKFNVETVAVMRKFLERNPQYTSKIQSLVAEGRLYIPLNGDNIIDSNMVLGESLIRNYVTGMLWLEEHLHYMPRLATRKDSFGNCAQLPQIFNGCGIQWVTDFDYTNCTGKYWRGIDGSTILQETLPVVGRGGGWKKYAPCPVCGGKGEVSEEVCLRCEGHGIERENMEKDFCINFYENAFGKYPAGIISVCSEELIPSEKIIDWADSMRNKYEVSFAVLEQAYPYIQPLIAKMNEAQNSEFHHSVEVNPNNTGCYVTRIKTKQVARRQEYALLSIESLAVAAFLQTGTYPKKELDGIWIKLLYTLAHDSITGDHVDDVYEDLKIVWQEIDDEICTLRNEIAKTITKDHPDVISVLNLTGDRATEFVEIRRKGSEGCIFFDQSGEMIPLLEIHREKEEMVHKILIKDIPPFSAKQIKVKGTEISPAENIMENYIMDTATQTNVLQAEKPAEQKEINTGGTIYSIENGRYRIQADHCGLLEIYDKKLKQTVSKTTEYRPGEYIMEHDEGSPWATLSKDMERIPLSRYTHVRGIYKEDGYQRLVFSVDIDVTTSFVINAFQIVYSVTLYEGLDRVDFKSDIKWDDFNHRLRIAFPVTVEGKYIYEVPSGFLERKTYESSFYWAGSNGDWPAINWAGVESPAFSAALLNKGTPSYKMEKSVGEGEVMLLTVLRSPSIPTYLHEPDSYSMTKWDGMRDTGNHSFDYAFKSYDVPFAKSTVVSDANMYNNGLYESQGAVDLGNFPSLLSDNLRISSVKKGEKDDSVIIRLTEYRGEEGTAEIIIPPSICEVSRVNLLERHDQALVVRNGNLSLTCKPFEIITLKFVFY